MKNVLVPIDFSLESAASTEYAAGLAQAFDAKITLLHAVASPVTLSTIHTLITGEKEISERDRKLMATVTERIAKKYAIKVESSIAVKSPADLILSTAERIKADVIIMGRKGIGESNSLFGSTTTAVMRRSKLPVMVIPEDTFFEPVETVTFATDYLTETESLHFRFLEQLVDKYKSFIHIVNVQKKEYSMSWEDVAGKMGTYAMFKRLEHSFSVVEDDDIINGIRQFLLQHPSDLLVMVARRQSFAKRFFSTEYTKNMTYKTSIPLLVLQE